MFDALRVGQDDLFHSYPLITIGVDSGKDQSVAPVAQRLQVHVARAQIEAVNVHKAFKFLCHFAA